MSENPKNTQATFGAGCFWCVEAIFQQLKGVEKVLPGYAGGHVEHPSYQQVCTGNTGHAEVAQITFDPEVISYETLLEVFWTTHDPTTLNRQGNDIGTQYRSVIFYHDEDQKKKALWSKKEGAKGLYEEQIVTQIEPLKQFYPAEDDHKDYYQNNPGNMYCQTVVRPKVRKFREKFTDLLKENVSSR